MNNPAAKIRVDKWLWHARLFKSRGLAGEVAGSGSLRINGDRVAKASQTVKPGDVLTFPKAGYIRVIQIDAIGERRGPAPEAQALYTDLDPPQPTPREERPAPILRDEGSGRPTKRQRREIDALRRPDP
ncbi:MAG: RNA-binding S4 domain-containing protein [Pseudomonadota bacterium]